MDVFEYWKKMADIGQQNMELWQKMTQPNPQILASLFDPWKPMMESLKKFGPQIVQNWNDNIPKEYMNTLNKKTLGMFQEWDKKILAMVQEMAASNFIAAYQKMMAQSDKIMEESKSRDWRTVMEYWQTMLTEYLKDMEIVAKETKKLDMQHLLEIWTKTITGQWDESVQKYAERFWETLKVKLTHGPEYYSTPDNIKVGQTPKEVVWEKGKWKLYHYKPSTDANNIPIFIVYALINKPYIDDLTPDVSLVKFFTSKGFDVYLTDWGDPSYEDRKITLDEFIEDGIGGMVNFISHKHNVSQVSILGHCMGGVLSAIYTSLHQDKVSRLVTLTAPVTAKKGGVVSAWSYLSPIDVVIDTFGNVPAKLIRYTFLAMKPYYEVIRWNRYYATLDKSDAKAIETANAVDKWVNDNVDIPGEFFRKFFKEVFINDALTKGTMTINNKKVNFTNILCPILNIFGEEDWIVTPESAAALNDLVGSKEKTARKIAGQHLGILFDPKNRVVWDEMASFFFGAKKE